jgi:DNA-binding transcriptional LysR family regulator
MARRIAPNPRVLCAAPSYLERAGTPCTLDDLANHECLTLSGTTSWPFESGGRAREVRVNGRFSSNNIEAVREACLGGQGLALLSSWDIVDEIRAGTLLPVHLNATIPQEISIWAIHPSARLVPPKLRVFVAALERALAGTINSMRPSAQAGRV